METTRTNIPQIDPLDEDLCEFFAQRSYERDTRFQQLLDLAQEGNEDAIGDLWREYSHVFVH